MLHIFTLVRNGFIFGPVHHLYSQPLSRSTFQLLTTTTVKGLYAKSHSQKYLPKKQEPLEDFCIHFFFFTFFFPPVMRTLMNLYEYIFPAFISPTSLCVFKWSVDTVIPQKP